MESAVAGCVFLAVLAAPDHSAHPSSLSPGAATAWSGLRVAAVVPAAVRLPRDRPRRISLPAAVTLLLLTHAWVNR